MSINFSEINTTISNGSAFAYQLAGKLTSHSVIWIKSSVACGRFYMQDTKIAAISFLAVCLFTCQTVYSLTKVVAVSKRFTKVIDVSKTVEGGLKLAVNVAICVSVNFGFLYAFIKIFSPALSNTTMAGIGLAANLYYMK